MSIARAALILLLVSLAYAQNAESKGRPRPPIPFQGSFNVRPPRLVFAPPARTPRLALIARIQGAVRMLAEIDEQGAVASLMVQDGHPFLIAAALETARRYRYTPVNINGVPVRIETTVTIEFKTKIAPLKLRP